MTTIDPLTFTQTVMVGFAQLLDTETTLSYSDSADYADDETGIFTSFMPADPDRLVTINANQLSADPTLSQATFNVKFRSRGAADAGEADASGLDYLIQNVLGGRFPITLPNGLRVPTLSFSYGGSLGLDPERRFTWSSNFTCGVGRPGAHRH